MHAGSSGVRAQEAKKGFGLRQPEPFFMKAKSQKP
jgi:hypothetical protein